MAPPEQIDVFGQRRVVRVTAKKDKALSIIQAIAEATKNIHSLDVALTVLDAPARSKQNDGRAAHMSLGKVFDRKTLKVLGHLTGTRIHRGPGNEVCLMN